MYVVFTDNYSYNISVIHFSILCLRLLNKEMLHKHDVSHLFIYTYLYIESRGIIYYLTFVIAYFIC